jgi:hypothetical protein
MVRITDVSQGQDAYWEVVCEDNNNRTEAKVPYYKNEIYGYDRVRALRQIADFYALMGYSRQEWEEAGKIFILRKP